MRNIASFENKLIEIEEAEEDLILHGSAWFAGVEFLKENSADMKKLADLKEHYKKKIDEILNSYILNRIIFLEILFAFYKILRFFRVLAQNLAFVLRICEVYIRIKFIANRAWQGFKSAPLTPVR